MSDSDYSDEENLRFFGKPLEPFDEDAVPKKRPISVEDQVARDAQGRRRFHGAFTGGFSAGFFNTVGSLEGWKPKEFRSSRAEKSEVFAQKPQDFMDDEDLGEFGFAPQKIKATKEYATAKGKRRRPIRSEGPIPGEPVLHSLLQSNETIGYLLLRNIGVKDKVADLRESLKNNKSDDSDRNVSQFKTTESNKLYEEHLKHPKHNTFGLSYVGLEKTHVPTFSSTKLMLTNRKQDKKLTISGQAFGVGAFEEDDDDIYSKDDLSNYDFEMTSEKSALKKEKDKSKNLVFDNFVASTQVVVNELFPPPPIPASFTGKYKVKKSRFEPLVETAQKSESDTVLNRKDVNAEVRRKVWNDAEPVDDTSKTDDAEQAPKKEAPVEPVKDRAKTLRESLMLDRFVSEGQSSEPEVNTGTQEMRDAAKMKMFGPLTRVTLSWQPCSLLCKRFNLPEPLYGETYTKPEKKRRNHLIFEYEKQIDQDAVQKAGLTVTKDSKPLESCPVEIEAETETCSRSNHVAAADIPPAVSVEKVLDLDTPPKKDTVVVVVESSEKEIQPEDIAAEKNEDSSPPLDITEKIDVSKNVDLFKAIFLSDDESEPEEEDDESESKIPDLKETILEDLLPRFKPVKEGLLSNISFSTAPGFHKFSSKQQPEQEQEQEQENEKSTKEIAKEKSNDTEKDPHLYGPKLPEKLAPTNEPLVFKLPKKSSSKEVWIEKERVKHKDKKEKKHKKDKDKKKKHKKRH